MLKRLNHLGIGPMGLGGDTTVLGLKIETAFCHTASLPVAINFQCWANRSATEVIPMTEYHLRTPLKRCGCAEARRRGCGIPERADLYGARQSPRPDAPERRSHLFAGGGPLPLRPTHSREYGTLRRADHQRPYGTLHRRDPGPGCASHHRQRRSAGRAFSEQGRLSGLSRRLRRRCCSAAPGYETCTCRSWAWPSPSGSLRLKSSAP